MNQINETMQYFQTVTNEVLSRVGVGFVCIIQTPDGFEKRIASNLGTESAKKLIDETAILLNTERNNPLKIVLD